MAITDLDENVLGWARAVRASTLDSADISGEDDRVSLVEAKNERAPSREECELSQGKDGRLLEFGNGEHDVRDFVMVICPHTSPILLVGVQRGEIEGDSRVVVKIDRSGHVPCEPLVRTQHIRDLYDAAEVNSHR